MVSPTAVGLELLPRKRNAVSGEAVRVVLDSVLERYHVTRVDSEKCTTDWGLATNIRQPPAAR